MDFKDFSKQVSSFSSRNSEGYMESQNKGKSIEGISDISNIGVRFRRRMGKLLTGEIIFTELIAQLKLRGFDFLKHSFAEVKLLRI